MKISSMLICLAFIAGCNSNSTLEILQPGLNEKFQLRVGQSATFDNGRLWFEFESVPSDSRCPENALCVWAGDAIAVLKYLDGQDTLHTYLEPKATQRQNYQITLVQLSPYPKTSGTIPQDEYVATFVVTKE